jgi:Ca2+-binding RTX toxin-like protein
MILLITMLASLSILFFAINAVEASLSDLDNIKPSRPINPETDSSQDEAKSPPQEEAESPTQDEAESGVANTRTYPTEEEYCRVNLLDGDSTREGYILKFGTNNDDELYGTPNRDLIFGLDGNDKIYGREGGDIICGGKGNDVIEGDPLGYNSDEVFQSKNGDNGDLPKSVSADLIFGQEGEDSILGGEGNDLIQGGTGDDSIYGHYGVWTGGEIHNDGNDLIDGGPGDDNCYDHDLKTFLNCEYTDDAIVK